MRPVGEARALLTALRRAGATAANLPLMRLRGRPAADAEPELIRARRAGIWIFSSPAAVRHASRIDAQQGLGLFGVGGFLCERAHAGALYAPGPGTAEALALHGVQPARTPPARFDSEGLLALPGLHPPLDGDIAIVGAPGGRGLIQRTLAERGASPVNVHVYRRERAPIAPMRIRALETARRPLLIVSSASLLMQLVAGLPDSLYRRLAAEAPLVVASQRLAERAAELGFQHCRTARSARPDALTDAAMDVAIHLPHP